MNVSLGLEFNIKIGFSLCWSYLLTPELKLINYSGVGHVLLVGPCSVFPLVWGGMHTRIGITNIHKQRFTPRSIFVDASGVVLSYLNPEICGPRAGIWA